MRKGNATCARSAHRNGADNTKGRTPSRDGIKRVFDASNAKATTKVVAATTAIPASSVSHGYCSVQDMQIVDTSTTTTTTTTTTASADDGESNIVTPQLPHNTTPPEGETVKKLPPSTPPPHVDELEAVVDINVVEACKPIRRQQKQRQAKTVQEEVGKHVGKASNGSLTNKHLLERIGSLEQMLLHMAALNKELEDELVETRRELATLKQGPQHLWRPPTGSSGGRGSSSNGGRQERHMCNRGVMSHPSNKTRGSSLPRRQQQCDQHNGVGGLKAMVCRRGEDTTAGCEESWSSSVEGVYDSMGPCAPHSSPSGGAAEGKRGQGKSGSGGALHTSGRGNRHVAGSIPVPVVEMPTHYRWQKVPQSNRPHSHSPSSKPLNPEEVLDMLETLKRSIMHGCNHSHRNRLAETKKPATVPRRGTQSVKPPPCIMSSSPRRSLPVATSAIPQAHSGLARQRNSSAPFGVGSRVGSGRNNIAAAAASSPRATTGRRGLNSASNRVYSPNNGRSREVVTKKEAFLSPPRVAGAEATEIEALQRKYWEQSREILEKLDHMLAGD